MVAVHLEEPAQVLAEVRAAEAVRAEHLVAAGDPLADAIGKRLHVIGCRNDGRLGLAEALLDPRLGHVGPAKPRLALASDAVAAQLRERRDAPDIRGNAEVLAEETGRRLHLAEDRA